MIVGFGCGIFRARKEEEEISERAILVGLNLEGDPCFEMALDELEALAKTAGAEVIEKIVQKRKVVCAKTYLGKGKVLELKEILSKNGADLVIFNNDLTGTQVRNLESIIGTKVIDRTELILDIFARRAKTREAKIQVELAQLNYLLPRLRGKGVSLSRLGGGIGTRGPGETKLEYDRREIRNRLTSLKRALVRISRERAQQRSGRKRFIVGAIVGYTNAGKSTLFNALTRASVKTEDGLFATLDPTTRCLLLPNNQRILLIDTVGFIQNLPHHLISSFKATLEEVTHADLLLHVVDVSNPQGPKQMKEVEKILAQLGAASTPSITALNKIDKVEDLSFVRQILRERVYSVAISALYSEGLDKLLDILMNLPPLRLKLVSIDFPVEKGRLESWIYGEGRVEDKRYHNGRVTMDVWLPQEKIDRLKRLEGLSIKE